MPDIQPGNRDESEEFKKDVEKIIHSKVTENKPLAIKSLLERLKNFYFELNLQDQLSSLEKILLSETGDAEKEFKKFVRDCNEKLIEMAETHARDEYELFFERNAKEMKEREKEEAYKAPSSSDDDDEIKTLDGFEKEINAFVERNKDGFRNSLQNSFAIQRLRNFQSKFNQSPHLYLARSGKKISELKIQMNRCQDKLQQINDMLKSQSAQKRLEDLDEKYRQLEGRRSYKLSSEEQENLSKEIQLNRLQAYQTKIEVDVKQNLQERIQSLKTYEKNPLETSGVINQDNYYAYRNEILELCKIENGDYIPNPLLSNLNLDTPIMLNSNIFSSQSLLEALQQEIPKTTQDETNEEYLKRLNAMDATALSADMQSTLALYQQSLTDEQVNQSQTEVNEMDDKTVNLEAEPKSEPVPKPEELETEKNDTFTQKNKDEDAVHEKYELADQKMVKEESKEEKNNEVEKDIKKADKIEEEKTVQKPIPIIPFQDSSIRSAMASPRLNPLGVREHFQEEQKKSEESNQSGLSNQKSK